MGHGTTCTSAVVASLFVSGALLQATGAIPEVSHDQVPHETLALTIPQNQRQAIARAIGWLLSFVFVVGMAPAVPRAEDNNPSPYDRAVTRAIALLPRRPIHVAVIDANEAKPEVRETLLKLDAFTLRLDAVTMDRSKVVYLVKQSVVLQEAAKGSQLYEHVLASIIWHEMAHLDGADERGARHAEEQLWTRFVRDGVFDPVTALRYLNALTKRPDDRLMASR